MAATLVVVAQTVADTVSAMATPLNDQTLQKLELLRHAWWQCGQLPHQRNMLPPRREPPVHGDPYQHHGRLHAQHAQDQSSQCRRLTGSTSSPPLSTHRFHSHLLPSLEQRPAFTHDSRQLGFWTPRRSLPASQQCPSSPTWYCNDAKHNGLRRPLPAGAPALSRTTGPTQSRVVQQFLTGRGGR